jgi:hypothetical protein
MFQKFIELIRTNANRCISLVVVEIVVISLFHRREWSLFLRSEIMALSLHLILSLFGLCFFVMMRSNYKISKTPWYARQRLLGDSILYTIFDYLIIHVLLVFVMQEFHFHFTEYSVILIMIYTVNLIFDSYQHHCCHEHCQ